MKKCLLTMLIVLSCGAIHAADIDYTHMKPLKLTVDMPPKLGGDRGLNGDLSYPQPPN